ncbi:MAG: hypothetical protein WA045_14565 [Nitrospira sp.]
MNDSKIASLLTPHEKRRDVGLSEPCATTYTNERPVTDAPALWNPFPSREWRRHGTIGPAAQGAFVGAE